METVRKLSSFAMEVVLQPCLSREIPQELIDAANEKPKEEEPTATYLPIPHVMADLCVSLQPALILVVQCRECPLSAEGGCAGRGVYVCG